MAIWNILQTFGIFYDHLVHLVIIWYIFPVWISCTKKNLATPVNSPSRKHHFSFLRPYTEALQRIADGEEVDGDEIRPLSAMFRPGQLVVCSVVSVEKRDTVGQPFPCTLRIQS
jgi:hypothetical protein